MREHLIDRSKFPNLICPKIKKNVLKFKYVMRIDDYLKH